MKPKRIFRIILLLILIFAAGTTLICQAASKRPSLNVTEKKMSIGMKYSLVIKNKPSNAKYKWTSSDKSVATVSNSGEVTAIKAGKTYISCKITWGKNSANCKVLVTVNGPKFRSTSGTLVYGQDETLLIQYKPKSAKYKWSSSDKSVAVVFNKGVVTPINEGKVTISCKVTWGKNSKTIKYKADVKKTSFKNESITLYQGQTDTILLENTVSDAEYQWSSSNKKIATVSSNGTVKALANGTAIIRCKITIGKKKVNCSSVITVKSATINESSISMKVGESFNLTVTPVHKEATYKWSSSNAEIATVSSIGNVTAKKEGLVTITCFITLNEVSYKLTTEVTITEQQKPIPTETPTQPPETPTQPPDNPSQPPIQEQITVSIVNPISSIKVGEEYIVQVAVTPASYLSQIKWNSSDTTIAEIDEKGVLMPKKQGTVTITAVIGESNAVMKVNVVEKYTSNQYYYDKLGRLIKVVYTDGSSVIYEYDANGNIKEVIKK